MDLLSSRHHHPTLPYPNPTHPIGPQGKCALGTLCTTTSGSASCVCQSPNSCQTSGKRKYCRVSRLAAAVVHGSELSGGMSVEVKSALHAEASQHACCTHLAAANPACMVLADAATHVQCGTRAELWHSRRHMHLPRHLLANL